MTKVLLLVHVEETFRKFFSDDLLNNIEKAINNGEFDEVIHFTSGINNEEPVEEITTLVDEEIDWGWGYEPEVFENQPHELEHVIESIGHEYTWIPPELRERASRLKNCHVTLGGGYHAECLADMVAVLNHLDIPFDYRREFVY